MSPSQGGAAASAAPAPVPAGAQSAAPIADDGGHDAMLVDLMGLGLRMQAKALRERRSPALLLFLSGSEKQ